MISSTVQLPFLQRFRPMAYAMVLLAIAAFSYAESNAPLFFLGTIGTLVSWWLVERPRGNPLPRALINLGVLAASSALFYELVLSRDEGDHSHPNLLLALGHFMVAIMLCKLFERKSNRDYAQILTLTLLVMVAGSIVATSSFFFALLLGAYLALGLYAILVFHLRAETERALSTQLSGAVSTVTADSMTTIRKDMRLVAWWSAFILMAVAAVVFLAFPRSSGQDMLSSWTGSSMSTGFSDHVRLRDFVNLRQSETVVMQVKLEQNGVNLGSETYQPYFRGMVLDAYDSGGRQWVRSAPQMPNMETSMTPGAEVQLVPPEKYNSLGVITQTYTLDVASGNTLFTLAPPVSITSDHLRSVVLSPKDLVVSGNVIGSPPITYTVKSPVIVEPGLYDDAATVKLGDLGSYPIYDLNGEHMMPSKVPPEVMKLAEQVAKDLLPGKGEELDQPRIRRIAEQFEVYLRKTYPYSLNFRAVDRQIDPTADFLLNRKETGGHCEFFASAMVMMCRAVGINARMATGYRGGEYNSLGGFYVVKQKFAHAWVEVFIPKRGWMTYDPSPAGADTGGSSSVSRWLHEAAEVMQKMWLSTVVAFDNTSRRYLFSTVGGFVEHVTSSVKGFLKDVTVGFRDLLLGPGTSVGLKVAGFGSLGLIGVLAYWLLLKWHRRRTSQIPRILRSVDKKAQRQLAQDLMFFDDLLRLLGRKGQRKSAEQTPREYVDSLAPRLRGATPDAHWLFGTFYAIRFGTLRVTATLRQQIDAALTRIRRELQHPS
jgi:transglutaminase-like putative cysteine protease